MASPHRALDSTRRARMLRTAVEVHRLGIDGLCGNDMTLTAILMDLLASLISSLATGSQEGLTMAPRIPVAIDPPPGNAAM